MKRAKANNPASEISSVNQEAMPEPKIRILKVGICPTLSGKSKLTYHIGCNDQSEILFRVHENSNPGYFNREWVSMNSIQQVSKRIPIERLLTSYLLLNPLFKGQSSNNPAFLMAVLKNEGLVKLAEGDDRYFIRTDGLDFFAEIKALIESGVDLKIEDKPKAKGKKVASKASINEA